jgi:hypothetical protein
MEIVRDEHDLECQTKSVLGAAHLVASGFPVLRAIVPKDSRLSITFCFSPAARDVLSSFYRHRDALLAAVAKPMPEGAR